MSSVDQNGAPRPRSSYEYVEGWGMAVGAPSRVVRPRSVEEVQATRAAHAASCRESRRREPTRTCFIGDPSNERVQEG